MTLTTCQVSLTPSVEFSRVIPVHFITLSWTVFTGTVELVYKDHLKDHQNVVFMHVGGRAYICLYAYSVTLTVCPWYL